MQTSVFGDNEQLLPYDGKLIYIPSISIIEETNQYLDNLMNNDSWRNDVVSMYGKKIVTNRKVAWWGDKPYPYTYSNNQKVADTWPDEVKRIKSRIEKAANEKFNSCLGNLYLDGDIGMSWHSDDEPELQKEGTIASYSLGAPRKFVFRHKQTKLKVEMVLQHGSLLLMKGRTQEYWQHALPKSKKVKTPRINLTFRQMKPLLQAT